MSRIRGKKLSRSQYKILEKIVDNVDEWGYLGIRHIDENGSKNVARNSSKTQYMVFINQTTGEEKIIQI